MSAYRVSLMASTRRASWHMDFIYQIGGITIAQDNLKVQFHNEKGDIEFTPAAMRVTGKLRLEKCIFAEDFTFLRSVARATPKLTIPSPSMVHYRGGRAAIDPAVYPDLEEFWHDLEQVYADQIEALEALGAPICNSTTPALPISTTRRSEPMSPGSAATASINTSPTSGTSTRRSQESPRRCASAHTCAAETSSRRGWRRAATSTSPKRSSTVERRWVLPRRMTTTVGRFEPLDSFRPASSWSWVWSPTKARSRTKGRPQAPIDEASRFVPLEQLCLSPQCGFSSTVEGNARRSRIRSPSCR